jgi:hypothetical protein
MNQKVNYKALAISVIAAALIFGYMLVETSKLEEAAASHRPDAAEPAAVER